MTINQVTRCAIVTGGSRGFGLALAGELTRAGWAVIADGRDPESLARGCAVSGAIPVVGDVADARHRRGLVARAAEVAGRLDLVVNNAGNLGPSPLPALSDCPIEALSRLYEVNVLAPLGLAQEALPLLRASGGTIVNLTSDAAVEAYPGWGAYGSSKAALEALSRVLAVEVPEVRIWWCDPGDMRTDMHQAAFPDQDIGDRPHPADVAPVLVRLLVARPPSGRVRLADLAIGGAA